MRTINKILIIRFSSLGDILLATPLIRTLRKSFPEAIIDFCVKSEYASILKGNPHLSSVIELRTSEIRELRELKTAICRERYDLIVDIHNSLRSRYLRFFSAARMSTVVKKSGLRRFILVHLKKNLYEQILPIPDRYISTVRRFGVLPDGLGLELHLSEDVVSSVTVCMAKYKLDRHRLVVGIVPSARHFTKRWLPERFVELGKRFARDYQAKILVFGGKEEADSCGDIVQMINADLGYTAAENLAGALTLTENAAAFDFCNLVVTNDTGLMHLAATRGVKIVAIFGSTVREFGFFPYGTMSRVVETTGLPCRPCTTIGRSSCPEKHFRCMSDITVNRVYDEAAAVVRSGAPAPDTA